MRQFYRPPFNGFYGSSVPNAAQKTPAKQKQRCQGRWEEDYILAQGWPRKLCSERDSVTMALHAFLSRTAWVSRKLRRLKRRCGLSENRIW